MLKPGYRYVVCGDCGEIWNIAKEQDTRHGYLCPQCAYKRRMERRKKMDKLIITLLVVIGVLVLFLGIALEEIKALQQDKRDWKNRYYAAAQIRAKDRI